MDLPHGWCPQFWNKPYSTLGANYNRLSVLTVDYQEKDSTIWNIAGSCISKELCTSLIFFTYSSKTLSKYTSIRHWFYFIIYICFLTSNESYSPLGWLLCEFSISRAINAEAQYGQGCKQSLVVFFWQKSQEAYNKNKILRSFWVNHFSFIFSIPYLSEIKPNLGQTCDARLETCFAAGVTAPCSALPLGEHQSLGLESGGWSQLLRSD